MRTIDLQQDSHFDHALCVLAARHQSVAAAQFRLARKLRSKHRCVVARRRGAEAQADAAELRSLRASVEA